MSARTRFADVVRSEPVDVGLAALLAGAVLSRSDDPDGAVDDGLRRLDDLAAAARGEVPRRGGPRAAAEGLHRALGRTAGFAGSDDDYGDVRSSLLHEVLRRRRGLPLLLSVVWVEVARRLDVPAWCIALPGHVVAGVGDPDDEHAVVDPFAGGRLLDGDDVERLMQRVGAHAAPELRPVDPVDLLLRLLTNVRVLTTRMPPSLDAARTRLSATDLSLLLPRHSLELRRERGELLVRLGDHLGGAAELERYADAVGDEDAEQAEAARRGARAARARLN
ncbi:MAG TPA: transglutaminase-like domain-containing protein [Mycobacteriales bacterium]|nr:transglutaminase-like domain-containing protein [Mycobacteriales bacterium]